jgi:Zn-dependent peptidase ImmA (M78 family)
LGLSGFYHRKLSRAGARSVNAIESRCLLDVVALRDLLGMVDSEHPESVLTIHLDDIKGGPEKAADMLRLAWQIPRGPIFDLCGTVERHGCLVIHNDFNLPDMDALYQKTRGVPPIFWVNSTKPLDRVRLSIAHELGHLVLHEEEPVDEKLAEDQANAFGAAFLMPRADFRSECPSRLGIPQLVEMKRRWRCSMQAIIRRAYDVNRIDARQYKNLMIRFSKEGWRKQEPYPITGESPRMLSSVVRTCIQELDITEQELADRLAVPVEQVMAWLQPFPGERPDPVEERPRLRYVADY